ncbi:hypothetical protein VNO78_17854 [Psophocarpus tetragonolobus]|uniref:Uncharacterized protein n=1 Tax=Psophocarpus tetragonolobus TaxID=3891 RepID=A0AAN9SIT1_PSOTE
MWEWNITQTDSKRQNACNYVKDGSKNLNVKMPPSMIWLSTLFNRILLNKDMLPPADIADELHPGNNVQVHVDPVSSDVATTKEYKNMDISNPVAFVNAELLHFNVGRRVRTLMQVVRSDGGVVIGKSTDEKQIVVKGSPPPVPLTTFVEVVGIVNSDKSIVAEIWTNFGDAIDMVVYNKLCQLANGEFKHLFL